MDYWTTNCALSLPPSWCLWWERDCWWAQRSALYSPYKWNTEQLTVLSLGLPAGVRHGGGTAGGHSAQLYSPPIIGILNYTKHALSLPDSWCPWWGLDCWLAQRSALYSPYKRNTELLTVISLSLPAGVRDGGWTAGGHSAQLYTPPINGILNY